MTMNGATSNGDDVMSCAEVMTKLYSYLDSEEDMLTEADIEQHLRHCRECFGRVEFEKRLRERVAQTGSTTMPDDLRRRMIQLISKF